MKKIYTGIGFILLVFLFNHCLQKKEPQITKDLIEFSGRYVGILPCADCEGIKYDLVLSADGTFGEDSKYIGKSDEIIHHAGDWKLINDSTLELKINDEQKYFLSRNDHLLLLDNDQNIIESSFAEKYELKRVEDGFEKITEQAMNMGRMGRMAMPMEDMETDFKAHGNEPFWNLKVDFESDMTFKTMEGMEITFDNLKIDQELGSNILRIEGTDGLKKVNVKITEGNCSDSMTDQLFRNKVKVSVSENGTTTNYQGCGNYAVCYQLHDIWVLEKINGKPIKEISGGIEKAPTFEFYSKEERLMGNLGCNDFNGAFYRCGKDILQFGELAVTKMACPDMSIENILTKALSGKKVKYEFKDLNLYLTGSDDTQFTFQKVD